MKRKIIIIIMLMSALLSGCKTLNTETVAVYVYQETWPTYPANELLEKYYRQGNFEKAITYAESSMDDIMMGYVKDEDRIRWINAMIGDCYLELGKYEEGKTYIDTAMERYEKAGETKGGFYNLCYMEGKYYLKTNQYKIAIECFENSVKYAEALGNTDNAVEMDIARIYCDMGNTYMKLEDMSSALEMLKESYGIVSKRKSESEVAFIYYEDILEPMINDLFKNSSDGDMEYDEWFSAQFKE